MSQRVNKNVFEPIFIVYIKFEYTIMTTYMADNIYMAILCRDI